MLVELYLYDMHPQDGSKGISNYSLLFSPVVAHNGKKGHSICLVPNVPASQTNPLDRFLVPLALTP